MTDEEQTKLCEDLRQVYRYIDNDEINELIWQAADEIEQQTKLVAALRNPEHDRFPARTARDAAKEIERLEKENGQLKDIIHQINCDLMEALSPTQPR